MLLIQLLRNLYLIQLLISPDNLEPINHFQKSYNTTINITVSTVTVMGIIYTDCMQVHFVYFCQYCYNKLYQSTKH